MPRIFRLTLLLVVVSSSLLFSQVIIREKVEIVPQLSTVAAQGGGEVEVTLFTSGNIDLVNRKPFVSIWNVYCGLYQSSGGPGVKIPAQTGLRYVNAGFSTLGVVTYQLQVNVGSDVILADSGVAPANTTVRLTPQFMLTSGVDLSFGNSIFHGEQSQLIVKNRPFTWCSTPVWHSAMMVTLEITGGKGLGMLTTGTGSGSDSALMVKGSELANVKFIANGRQPSGETEPVVIEAKVGGVGIASPSVLVYPTVTVKITNPVADTTITLSATNQPLLLLQEVHTPGPGQAFEPTITWSPSNAIDTKTYYGQIKDTLKLVMIVTAENARGSATDTRTITLVKKGCEDAPQCAVSDIPPPPSLTIVPRPNGFNNHSLTSCQENSNALGVFIPIVENNNISIQPFNVDVCFDKQSGQWRVRIVQPIEVNALLDLCYNNKRGDAKFIGSVNEVDQFDRCSVAKSDFKGHYSYPIRYEKYLLRDVLLMHEDMHRRDFQEKVFQTLQKVIPLWSVLQTYKCENFANVETAKKTLEKQAKNFVKSSLRDAANYWEQEKKSEQEIHKSEPVKLLIRDFVAQLNCVN